MSTAAARGPFARRVPAPLVRLILPRVLDHTGLWIVKMAAASPIPITTSTPMRNITPRIVRFGSSLGGGGLPGLRNQRETTPQIHVQ